MRRHAARASACAWIATLLAVSAGADETADTAKPTFPSKIILGVRATCMEACQEKEDPLDCALYCDCHLFELRRDLSDRQLEQMLLTAERGGTNAESIRAWMIQSAKLCEERVFGEKAKNDSAKPADDDRAKAAPDPKS